ncbi:FtsX-like permease family protein, partial [bacterium]|nr:FtsX-like permease family protein [bacterium]
MLKNYLLTALRSMLRHRLYTLINIAGLSIGMTAVLFTGLYALHELSYNRHFEDHDKIYRILRDDSATMTGDHFSSTVPADIVPDWLPQLHGIEATARVAYGYAQVQRPSGTFEQRHLYVDPGYFQIFRHDVLAGQSEEFLTRPHTVVLTRTAAMKYFNRTDPVGETLLMAPRRDFEPFEVVGVIEDMPANSSMKTECFIPFQRRYEEVAQAGVAGGDNNHWFSLFSSTYVKLSDDADPHGVEQTLRSITVEEDHKGDWSRDPERYRLQALTDMHLMFRNPHTFPVNSSASSLYTLLGIGLLILLIAASNFTMLTISLSVTRQHEIGVRKVLGASPKSVSLQMFLETVCTGLVAMLLSLVLVDLLGPLVKQITGEEVGLEVSAGMLLVVGAAFLLTILLAGTYPALRTAGFPLLAGLRGELRPGGKGRLRRGLVLVQVGILAGLMMMTLAMMMQFHYITSKELGYHGEHVVILHASAHEGLAEAALERLRPATADDPGIVGMTVSGAVFGRKWNWIEWEGKDNRDRLGTMQNTVGPTFL